MARFWRRNEGTQAASVVAASAATTATAAVPVVAAPSIASTRAKLHPKPLKDLDWQARIRRYDDEGPGIVGQYLDLRSFLGSQAATVARIRTARGWRVMESNPESSNREKALLALVQQLYFEYSNVDQTCLELFFDHCRALSGPAECALGYVPADHYRGAYGYVVAQGPELRGGGEQWQWRDERDEMRPFLNPVRSHVYNRAKASRKEPYSPLKRALPDIERIVLAAHGQVRPLASRLVANGILRVPFPRNPEANDDLLYDLLDAADSDILDLRYMGSSVKDGRRLVPYLLEGDESLEWIDLGRNVDQGLMQMENEALKAFARSVMMPLKLILEGPGSAKYANEDTLMTSFLRQDIQPLINTVYEAINRHYLRPRLAKLVQAAHTTYASNKGFVWDMLRGLDVNSIALGGDVETMILPADRAEFLLEAYKLGVVDRSEVARALGAKEMDLPDGMSKFAGWQLINGSWTGDGKPGNNLRGQPGATDSADAVAPPPDAPAVTAALATVAAPTTPTLTPTAIAVAASAPELTRRPGEVLALERVLRETDTIAAESISDWMVAMARRSGPALAAAAMRSLPARDEQRVALRGSDPAVIISSLDDRVDWAAMAAEVVAEWDTDELERILGRAQRALATLDIPIAPDVDRAAAVARHHAARFAAIAVSKPNARPAPVALAEVLMAAAGATAGQGNGGLLRGPDMNPMIDGIPWRGGTGFAVSPPVVASLRSSGYHVSFEWRHAFNATPVAPSHHQGLHGVVKASAEPAAWNGETPHKHNPNCSCAITLHLELAEPVPVWRPEVAA